jgi:hypothetical protein
MTLHPITLVDRALDEYRSYLATEFRASDPALRKALEDALEQAGFLAQEPFFQAHRPFKDGKAWRDLGIDAALARAMGERSGSPRAYLHQSDAIGHLLDPAATPLVVTTGTGSGKTECFLLPVIQNAIADAVRFSRPGLTALLVYPMNALANDQEERIRQYLEASGHGHVRVARYDRTTRQEDRESLRRSPPHILLTNYVMLEYLLVRPADREAIFANHRCRFVVLDEVHSYRGSLGANIALLYRRLVAHLRRALQDWEPGDPTDRTRHPSLVAIGTSATIKSIDETGKSPDDVARLRDEAVREFFSKLTGVEKATIRVLGETIADLEVPKEARWPAEPVAVAPPDPRDQEAVRRAVCTLGGSPEGREVARAAREAAVLWKLGELIARRPFSLSGIADRIRSEVPERAAKDPDAIRREVEAALVAGAALPDGCPGALRLRTHRFVRGGWRFHRCVDPACGRLHPMGEAQCTCGRVAAPLYLCRSCGADTLRFKEPEGGVGAAPLVPNPDAGSEGELLLYRRADGDDEDLPDQEMKGRQVLTGSFDPATCAFSPDATTYPLAVALAPARNRCLVCGAFAGSGSILTPVTLGTSAAVRVLAEGLVEALAEQNADKPGHDGKERLLIFADSRQDAAHQARFITYAGRYDRMRRRLVAALDASGGSLSIERAVQALMVEGVRSHDNPHALQYDDAKYLGDQIRRNASAWEEVTLLDDLAVSAAYRSSVFNLGLVGVRYEHLEEYCRDRGASLAARLGISTAKLAYLARWVLDEVRRRGALSRPLLSYHPQSTRCPEELRSADWERRVKNPSGFGCTPDGAPLLYLDRTEVPEGIGLNNPWRKPSGGGRGPRLEQGLKRLVKRLGGADAGGDEMQALLDFLCAGPRLLVPVKLEGFKKQRSLLQVNADCVQLVLLADADRFRCTVCNVRMPFAEPGSPCPTCDGRLEPWARDEVMRSRSVRRILMPHRATLVAGEHTAQVTGDARIELEESFKGPPSRSPINVLACSPTLEMGIDVGGLDAVVMRNVPPRPDNYAQRGGRAGRRSRVGVVVGYARSTPHDAYFYDKPAEMIAGEVPAPGIGLGNRDVVLRHLHAILFGLAEPGLAGRMAEYVTLQGEVRADAVKGLLDALAAQMPRAAEIAADAWEPEILGPAGLATKADLEAALSGLPARIGDLFDRVRLQILQLEEAIKRWTEGGLGKWSAIQAMELKKSLLGIRGDDAAKKDADDRASGHPMRRFAEFGILPGYEFPSEPCTLRLLRDRDEGEPVAVERRFGIAQYQPDARAHARGHRWRVIGLDLASPWNPKTPNPTWIYTVCRGCELRYGAQEHPSCPRCGSTETLGGALPGHDFGGFVAVRDDTPVLEEEDRFAIASLVQCHPQRGGELLGRFVLPTGAVAELRAREDVRWVNEWKPPSEAEKKQGRPYLHEKGRGFYLCPHCGRVLTVPEESGSAGKGRKKARRSGGDDPFGHARDCPEQGKPPRPLAIATRSQATTLRLLVRLPLDFGPDEYARWGLSLGYALRIGMRQLYMLDGPEIEFVLEPMWETRDGETKARFGALTFVDAAVGGSGFLERAAHELDRVAARTIEHLDHPTCETACYRCLKSYNNQRHHESLSWPRAMPDLESLATSPPEPVALDRRDVLDPKPWLEAFDAGVGSPLELAFLRLFERHGLAVDKQVSVAPGEGERAISAADFVVKGTRVAIYVDGAAFHKGERLRRDRAIRERLRKGSLGWAVVELRAADLARGEALVKQIASEAERRRGAATTA